MKEAPPTVEQQFPVRTSARKAINTCEWAWERAYVDNLKPHTPKPAFRFGTLVHSSLEKFYRPGLKRGPHPAKTFKRLYDRDVREHEQFGVYSDEQWVNAGELGVAMMIGHHNTYGKDQRYKVIATEQPFRQHVYETVLVRQPRMAGAQRPRKVKQRRYRFTYVGVLDGIWLDTESGRLLLVDHKTAASIDQLVNSLALDVQSTAYWTWGVDWLYEQGLLKPKQQLDGLLYNIMRKAKPPDEEPPKDEKGRVLNKPKKEVLVQFYVENNENRNANTVDGMLEELTNLGHQPLQLGEPSKRQPAPLFKRHPSFRGEHERQVAREYALLDFNRMNAIWRGKERARKMYPSGPFGCTGCQFKDICELHETGDDWEAMRDATMGTWDPYSEHEIYEAR